MRIQVATSRRFFYLCQISSAELLRLSAVMGGAKRRWKMGTRTTTNTATATATATAMKNNKEITHHGLGMFSILSISS
jgi:hypothetical protein